MRKALKFYYSSVDFLFYILCGLIAVKPEFLHFKFGNASISLTSARNFAIFFSIYVLPYVVEKFREHFKENKNIFILAVCYIWIAVSIIVNNERLFYRNSSFWVISVYFLFYLYVYLRFKYGEEKTFYNIFFWGFLIVNTGNLIFHFSKGINKIIEDYPFWSGKNMFSVIAIGSFFTAVDFFYKNKRKLLAIFLASVSFANLMTVYSRAGLIAFVSAVFLWSLWFMLKKSGKKLTIGIFFMILVLAFSFVPSKNRLRLKDALMIKDYNTRERIEIWKGALKIIRKNILFGIGAGKFSEKFFEMESNFKFERIKEKRKNYHAHNLFLQIASESGILPAVLLSLYYGWILFYALVLYKENGSNRGMVLFLFAFFIYSFFDSSYNAKFTHSSMFHLNLIILLFLAYIDAYINKFKKT